MAIGLRRYRVPLVALASATCAAASAAGALASTGGTAGDSPGHRPSRPSRTRASGLATWFGPGFYGKRTACGQRLTPSVVGVANRRLPCGTLVRVTYRGRNLTLPVLDRGPYGHHADWDLTAGAAEALGITRTVRIRTRVVGKTANTATLGLPPGSEDAAVAGGALAG